MDSACSIEPEDVYSVEELWISGWSGRTLPVKITSWAISGKGIYLEDSSSDLIFRMLEQWWLGELRVWSSCAGENWPLHSPIVSSSFKRRLEERIFIY